MKSILLFGGTFDPVHNGHVAMAYDALTETGTSQLTILPAGNPYQRGRAPLASAEQRKTMLELAFAGAASVSFDFRELERNGPTYTVDTLRELRQVHGERSSLIWLVGGDAFARLDRWHEWQSLFSLANFAVAVRQGEPHPADALSHALAEHLVNRQTEPSALRFSPAGEYAVLTAEVPRVSSTDIRARCANHQSIRGLAPDSVCDYIERHRLYAHEALEERN
ncbi:MAG: nicotinate-nucleotide adenylyltransferase [Usitatibacteraceae bacterium]